MEILDSLTQAILPLSLENKKQLLQILEQQIFELEESEYQEDKATIDEIKTVKKEYEIGDYLNFNQYLNHALNNNNELSNYCFKVSAKTIR